LSANESEIEALKKHREELEAEMKRKASEHEAEIARHINDHKETLEEHTQRIQRENLDMMNKVKAEHDAEMERLYVAEAKVEELTRQLEKEREESAAMHTALELLNSQLKEEHHEKLSDYEQQMLKLEAERKQIEDDLAAHKDEISSHKEAIDQHLGDLDDHKDKLSTYESELEELRKHREELEAEMKRKVAEHEAEVARHIDDHKETLEEHTQRIQRENMEMMSKIKAEHDAEMKRLHDAEAKVEELTRQLEVERLQNAAATAGSAIQPPLLHLAKVLQQGPGEVTGPVKLCQVCATPRCAPAPKPRAVQVARINVAHARKVVWAPALVHV
jgi:chromosome segregation protein